MSQLGLVLTRSLLVGEGNGKEGKWGCQEWLGWVDGEVESQGGVIGSPWPDWVLGEGRGGVFSLFSAPPAELKEVTAGLNPRQSRLHSRFAVPGKLGLLEVA